MTDVPSDGLIIREPECHCFMCGDFAGGLQRENPQRDLRERGWVRINRRWHCPDCAKARGK